jgi:hypothetical protein
MKMLVMFSLVLASTNVLAAEKKFFVNGKETSAGEATLASLKGTAEVYKCTQVEAKASKKTGNISLKAKDSD